MADINWITVADRLLEDARSLDRASPSAATVLSFLSYALRDGVDAAERFKIEKIAHAAADRHAENAFEARAVLLPGWRAEFVKQFMEQGR